MRKCKIKILKTEHFCRLSLEIEGCQVQWHKWITRWRESEERQDEIKVRIYQETLRQSITTTPMSRSSGIKTAAELFKSDASDSDYFYIDCVENFESGDEEETPKTKRHCKVFYQSVSSSSSWSNEG